MVATTRTRTERWEHEYRVTLPECENTLWLIERFTPDPDSIAFWRAARDGRGVEAVPYTRLVRKEPPNKGLWMSDTPAEVRDHYDLIRRAKGRVLIHGLGLGLCIHGLLKKPEISHIDVVEICPELISLVRPHYADPRVVVHQGDALTFKFPRGTRWDYVWHDIWIDNGGNCEEEMKLLHRRYGRYCDWQESWPRAAEGLR